MLRGQGKRGLFRGWKGHPSANRFGCLVQQIILCFRPFCSLDIRGIHHLEPSFTQPVDRFVANTPIEEGVELCVVQPIEDSERRSIFTAKEAYP